MKRTFTFLMSLFLAVGTMWADVNAELTSKYVSVGGDATELTAGTWYALYNHARGCYVSEETSAFKMRKAAIAEGAEAEGVAGKLFKLTAAETDGEYYLMSGNGLYFDFTVNNTSAVSESPVAYKIATIGTNAGHFYIQHATNSYVADGQEDGNNFVCWEKNVPANAGGNNCYHFKPVRLADNYEEFEIVYNYTYGDEVKYTETKKVVVLDSQFPDYPACSVALPLGVTAAAKPEGKVTASETKEIALSVNMPFEYVESLDDYENLSKADEETGNWKWYHLIFRPDYGKVLYYGGTADPIDASKTVVDEANEDAYSWAFVGNPFDGFKVVNKKAGSTKGLMAGENGGCVGDAAEVFKLTTSTWAENGFFMQSTTGVKQDRFNFSGNKLNYWNNADMGSTFQVKLRQTEAQKLAVLVAEVEDLLDEYKWEHEEEPALGQYSTAGYEALETAFEDDNRTIESLKAAIEAFRATRNMPIFTIDGAGKDYMQGKSIFVDENGALKVKATDATDKSMLWIFDMAETEVGVTDKVVVRNAATGELFWGADFIKVTETDPVVEDDGIFLFYKNGTGDPVHAQNDNGDVESVVTYWSYEATSGSAWKFTFVGVSNPAAYDLSEVKEEFAAQVAAFAELGEDEAFDVLEDMKNNWSSVNSRMQKLAGTIEAGGLVLKSEVESAMSQMRSYFAVPEAYAAYKIAKADADAAIEALKDAELSEDDQAAYVTLQSTVAMMDEAFPYASSAMDISTYKGMLENVSAPFYDIDAKEVVEGTEWGEAYLEFDGERYPVIENADLKIGEDSPEAWGMSLWATEEENVFEYDKVNGVLKFTATDARFVEDKSGNKDNAAYLQKQGEFATGKYRLTGKAYYKNAVNAEKSCGYMFVGEQKIPVMAVTGDVALGAEHELVYEFTAQSTVQYGMIFNESFTVGYSCEFENPGDEFVVGGFKIEMIEMFESPSLREEFQTAYSRLDMSTQSMAGFANIQHKQYYPAFEALHPAYEALLAEVNAIYDAMDAGQKVLKAKVAKATEDMKKMEAEMSPVIDYAMGEEYFAATNSAKEQMGKFMEESDAYQLIKAAYDDAEDFSEVTELAQLQAKVAAIKKAIADALAQIPTKITLDKEEAKLNLDMLTVQLVATVVGAETAEQTVYWESSDEEVATVDADGKVTAVGEGTAYITAYSIYKDVNAECVVYVDDLTIYPTGVTLNLSVDTLTTAGATVQLEATVAPEDAEDKTITWTTSDEKVATVDADGKVTAVANGTAVITATAVNGVKATCTIVVAIPEDEDNGIESIEVEGNAVIYDIHGRRVEKMEKGFFIVNGRKVLVK